MQRRNPEFNYQNAYPPQNLSRQTMSTGSPLYTGSVRGSIMPSHLDRPVASIPNPQLQSLMDSRLSRATSMMPSRLDAPQNQQYSTLAASNQRAYTPNITQASQPRQSPYSTFRNRQYNCAAGPNYIQQSTSLQEHIHKISAARQLNYNSLSHSEKLEQESWAQEQIKMAGACVANYPWRRQRNGYRCEGTNHYITDQLLANGNGGFYQRSDWKRSGIVEMWRGPVYDLHSSMYSTLPLVPGPELGIPDQDDYEGGLEGLTLNDRMRRRGGNGPQMVKYSQ